MNVFAFYDNNSNVLYTINTTNLENIDELPTWLVSINCDSHSSSVSCHLFKYENINTILTEEEFNMLCNIKLLTKDSAQSIIDKLKSSENEDLLYSIVDEEKEILMEEHGIDEDEYNTIANNFSDYYLDRNCVSVVYCDYEELGQSYVDDCERLSLSLYQYFDFESLGRDMVNDNSTSYVVLPDDRIVCLNK